MTISDFFYFLQTIMAYNAVAAIILFIVITLMLSLAALLLPIETRGRAMKVSSYCRKFETVAIATLKQLSYDYVSLYIGLWAIKIHH